ncbi:MAG TPA: hypothetical protein VK582_26060 [Pyrinomonadaceae bacterium]|nr:hypothetical protein [Pyrinomonadaceae bacterium]
MDGKIHRPARHASPADTGRVALRLILLLIATALWCGQSAAQSSSQFGNKSSAPPKPAEIERSGPLPATQAPGPVQDERVAANSSDEARPEESTTETSPSSPTQTQFRIERLPMIGGAEVLTIFGRLDGMRSNGLSAPEVPLVSVVRDTLSDNDPENDRLRYVWMLTYTQPTLIKRIASAIPFLYQHVGNKTQASKGLPAPILDLANTKRKTWNHFFWMGLQNVFLDSYGIPLKAASRSYRRNAAEYRQAHITQALSILSNYENLRQRTRDESELLALSQNSDTSAATTGDGAVNDTATPLLPERSPAFTPGEMLELRARLILSGKTFGGFFGPGKFSDTVEKQSMASIDTIGHNWEMLRQRAEAEGLYFQPLTMPDGRATHGLLWISRSDLAAQASRSFNQRFLNIANPWSDARLHNWNGYTQTRYLDQDNRPTTIDNPGAHSLEMIPLALYGLDHPKIPALLVDFRDGLNPKGREMSQRALNDLAKNIFSLSSFGNIPYFLGRSAYNFITGRRGMDLNQPTRLNSYSELKLLMSFNASLDPKLQREIERRLEIVSVNPLSNDNQSEVQLARQQYDALVDFARRPDGLAAKIERDRRAEMVPLKHGALARFFINLGNVVSFGRYVHRERMTPELSARMEMARRIERHTNFLGGVAKSSPQTEVAWDVGLVKHSLEFLADHGAGANDSAARATALIFQRTNDAEARRLCLDALSKMNSKTAKHALLRLYNEEQPHSEWRLAIAERLRKAVAEDSRMKPPAARSVLNQVGQP